MKDLTPGFPFISIGLREKLQAYTRAQARLDDPPRE